MAIPTYLILATPYSGRRGLCIDMCKNAFADCKVQVFVSANEPCCYDNSTLSTLENVELVRFKNSEESLEKISEDCDVVIYVADSSRNIADEVEDFKMLVDSGKIRLARVWSIVDCKMNEMFGKQCSGYIDALSHFADCLLLSQRSGVSNASVNELLARFKKQCKPHLLVYMDKRNSVQNSLELSIEETRRISMLFDEYDPADELDIDEDNLPEEPFSLERKPDPYLEKLQNGHRKNPVADVFEFAKKAHTENEN